MLSDAHLRIHGRQRPLLHGLVCRARKGCRIGLVSCSAELDRSGGSYSALSGKKQQCDRLVPLPYVLRGVNWVDGERMVHCPSPPVKNLVSDIATGAVLQSNTLLCTASTPGNALQSAYLLSWTESALGSAC